MKRSMIVVIVVGLWSALAFGAGAAEMKTVIILTYPGDAAEHRVIMSQHAVAALKDAGFVDQENVAIQVWKDEHDLEAEIAAIKEINPAVVLDFSARQPEISKALFGSNIPLFETWGIEEYINADHLPKGNIGGVYTYYNDMLYNSYKFLRMVAPLKAGQQAVFLYNTQLDLIPRPHVEDALKRLNIPLKAVVDTTMLENWRDAVLAYNDDPTVGWILMGVYPTIKRDGSPTNMEQECEPWLREHLKKPLVTYWESAVKNGILCGLAVDLNESARQAAEMAARVLKGEDIKTIQVEYPRKTLVTLNRKTADVMGITIPLNALSLANVIYHDWEGKEVTRKSGLK